MKFISHALEKTRHLFYEMISLRGCPHKLAKSFCLGFTLAFLPLPGINVILSVVLAKLLNLNVLAAALPGLLLAYVSPFLYILNYKVGAVFIQTSSNFEYKEMDHNLPLFERIVDFFANLGVAYLLGSIISATVVAVVSYFAFYYFFKSKSNNISEKQQLINSKKIVIKKKNSFANDKPFVAKIKNYKKLRQQQ
ncbi:DUF2062 domain-containing protein [Peptococcaceae bacterium]|nr:DUF2062 domain-containing protein [Peptococcaceae bacterium]